MSRLSIEISPENHKRLKAAAELHGKSIKAYVLERALPPVSDVQSMSGIDALHQSEIFLKPRIGQTERGDVASMSVEQIFENASNKFDG